MIVLTLLWICAVLIMHLPFGSVPTTRRLRPNSGTWAAVGTTAVSVGGSLAASSMKGSQPGMMITSPYDQMVQNGQSGNFNDLANTNSTYLADMYSQLGTGQNPSYYQKYQNQAMPYYQNLLQQSFYGTPGSRTNNMYGGQTAMGNAQSQAAMFGYNPKAQSAQMGKVNQQYQMATQQLNQYFQDQGYGNMQDTAKSLPGWSTGQQNSMTDAFRPSVTPYGGQAAPSNPWTGVMGALGQNGTIDKLGGALGGGLGSMFSGGGVNMGALQSFGGGTSSYGGPPSPSTLGSGLTFSGGM